MYELISIFPAALVVLAGAYWLWKKAKVPAGAAPFVMLCSGMLLLSAAGCAGVLFPAVWVLYGAGIVGAGWMVYDLCIHRENRKNFFDFPVVVFAVGAVAILLLFWMRNPQYWTWDEFSFWGTAEKLVKETGELYVTAEIGWNWVPTHRPALIMLGYFFNFFGAYAEWRVYAAYGVLILSMATTMMACVKTKAWQVQLPLGGLTVLTVAIMTVYAPLNLHSEVYCSTLADVPMGLMMGTALVLYFGTAERKVKNFWMPALALMTLCLVKDTGFALALVALALMAADLLLQWWLEKPRDPIWHRLLVVVLAAVGCVAAFLMWNIYLGSVSTADTSNVGGVEQMGMVQMLLQGLKETFIPSARSEKFARLMGRMVQIVCAQKATMLGSGMMTMLFSAGLLVLAIALSKNKKHQLRCTVYGVLGCAGFVAYVLFIGFTYVYVFRDEISADLVGANRYLSPYYMGFFLGALVLLGHTAAENARMRLGRLALCGLCAVCLLRVAQFVPAKLMVLDQNPTVQWNRTQITEQVDWVTEDLDPDSRIFFISQGDNGNNWFMNSYAFYPYVLDYSFGGGTFALPGMLPEDTLYYIPLTQQEFLDYLVENDCEYVYVELNDQVLRDSYGELFSDGLAEGGVALYRLDESKEHLELVKRKELK